MDIEDLRQVIEGPASVRVLYFDPPELVDDLIKEVIQTPGALPLLSFTLSELYVKYVQERPRRPGAVGRGLPGAGRGGRLAAQPGHRGVRWPARRRAPRDHAAGHAAHGGGRKAASWPGGGWR